MAIKQVRNVGQYGVISDIPAHAIPVNAWTDARNVSFTGYSVTKRAGFVPEIDTAKEDIATYLTSAKIHEIIPSLNEAQGQLETVTVYAGNKHVWRRALDGTISLMDKSGNPGYNASLDYPWRSTNFSNAVVLTNPNDFPQAMSVSDLRLSDLPAWGVNTVGGTDNTEYWRTPKIASYKNFLIALSTTEGPDKESAVYRPQRVRWSDISDVGQLPQSWDEASLTNSAGYMDLTDATGAFVEALPMRSSLLLYSNEETFRMTYVGGNTIFRFDKVFDDLGVLNQHCVGKFGMKHIVVTDTDVRVHDGSSHTSIVEGLIKERLFREIRSANSISEVKVKVRESASEVWICYKSNASTPTGYQDMAAIFNWEDNTWTFADLPNTTVVQEVPDVTPSNKKRWEDYTDVVNNTWGSIAEAGNRWSSLTRLTGDLFMTGFCQDNAILRLSDKSTNQLQGRDEFGEFIITPLSISLRRDGFDFDVEGAPLNSFKKVKAVYPQFVGDGIITIDVGGRNLPNDKTLYQQTCHYFINNDYKADYRINARYFSISFSELDDTQWQFTDYDIDFELGGIK